MFNMEIKEFDIPVPWGHIAVKCWGNENDTSVLTVHGFGDNAGSFDRLIPLLPQSFCYICIDLPGHGKSSSYPPYLVITSFSHLQTLKLVINYLNRGPYIFMGHSLGGQLLIYFGHLFPEHVTKLISFDRLYLYTLKSAILDAFRSRFENIASFGNVNSNMRPMYTYQEAKMKLNKHRYLGELNEEATDVLLTRSLVSCGNGMFQFRAVARLNSFTFPLFDLTFLSKIIRRHPIRFPILFLISEEYQPFLKNLAPILEAIQKGNSSCLVQIVIGNHSVHINSPENVAAIIQKYLMYGSKL